MRKSGLHKQISSIFDGVPVPQDGQKTDPPVEENQTPQQESAPQAQTPVVNPAPADTSPAPSLAQRMSDEQAAPRQPVSETPVEPVAMSRPMPLSRNQAQLKKKSSASISEQVKRTVAAKKAKMDPRQRKMTMLVGILSVAFAAVLFISLGGLSGPSGPAAANASTESTAEQTAANVKTVDDWKRPEPIPATLRDPMKPAARNVQDGQSGSGSQNAGPVTVRGIVFSKTRPTAIINETIMAEGESLNGVTIVNIEKDSVEFEKDGKRWTQQVQR